LKKTEVSAMQVESNHQKENAITENQRRKKQEKKIANYRNQQQ
jgi:hypothetical protein